MLEEENERLRGDIIGLEEELINIEEMLEISELEHEEAKLRNSTLENHY
jgi:hypothetical protein